MGYAEQCAANEDAAFKSKEYDRIKDIVRKIKEINDEEIKEYGNSEPCVEINELCNLALNNK